ncbi:MAG: phage portal protein [Methylobacteriaceae bacterium]|nr:phage portal protein [Methylobacteriaceae bacterium]
MPLLDRLFRRAAPEHKASRVGALVAAFSVGRPVWQERDFQKLAREGYRRNVIVYACIWFTAKAAADVPLKILRHRGTTNGAVAVPRLKALLDRPNPIEDGVSFRQAVVSDYLLGGNAFMERVDVDGAPRELYRWRPDRARVVPGPDGLPRAYDFAVGSTTRRVPVDFTRDAAAAAVLHWRDYNPTDDFYGMSPLDPAAFAIDGHTGAAAWNKALLDNGAQPSGALVYAPREGPDKLAEAQWERLRQELDQAFSGAANAGKPLLLDGGMDWKEMGLSPRDMSFVEGKNSSARDIALAIGVPPLLLGLPGDNTHANYAEANKAFYRQTVLPLIANLCRAWSWWLTPSFGQGLSIAPDVDALPVFADERASAWSRIEASSVLTVNEKRAALGYAPITGGDVLLVPATMSPFGKGGARTQSGAAVAAADTGLEPALKFSPDQPRVPAGSPDGGQWTSDEAPIEPAQNETSRQYWVDLNQEEKRGGHAIREHVGLSDQDLMDEVHQVRYEPLIEAGGSVADGSFATVEDANNFVNRTLDDDKSTVDLVAEGKRSRATLNKRFGYPTGKEAVWEDVNSGPYMQRTYNVRVIIDYAPDTPRGYLVRTAFPYNEPR